MLKKNWCLIVLLVVIVVGGILFYRWYRYYHYSPIEGHTETAPGTRSSDDYYACFKRSETNSVVLRANFTGIKAEDVMLVDLNMMGKIDPKKPVVGYVVDADKQIKISVSDVSGGTQITIVDRGHRFHLGPGPYMVVASAPITAAAGKSGDAYKKLFYYYQTYDKDGGYGPDQCPVYQENTETSKSPK